MRNKLLNLVGVVVFIGFITVGVANIRSTNNKIKFKEIELKSQEVKLKQLDERYQEVLDKKANTEAEKQEQQKKIEELEKEKRQLQEDLSAKLNKQQADKEKLARAAEKASGTQTVSALASGCDNVRQIMANKGFVGAELNAAVELARLESGCSSSAVNRSSNACNIYQEYRCGKWGGLHNTDAHINGAIGYMQASYGSWQNALNKWHARSPHWW